MSVSTHSRGDTLTKKSIHKRLEVLDRRLLFSNSEDQKMEGPVFKQLGRNIMRWQACHYSIREDNAINSVEYRIISKPLIRTGELLYHVDYSTEVQHRLYKHTRIILNKMNISNQPAFEQYTGVRRNRAIQIFVY